MKENNQKLNYYKIVSILSILLGAVLMSYMIVVEDELGALPLILILIGIVGFVINQIRTKKQNK